jgi:hypothetical protein
MVVISWYDIEAFGAFLYLSESVMQIILENPVTQLECAGEFEFVLEITASSRSTSLPEQL